MKLVICSLILAVTGLGAQAQSRLQVTCYLGATSEIGQVSCIDHEGNVSSPQTVSIVIEDANSGRPIFADLELTISGAVEANKLYGRYRIRSLSSDVSNEWVVTVSDFAQNEAAIIPVATLGTGAGATMSGADRTYGSSPENSGTVVQRGTGPYKGKVRVQQQNGTFVPGSGPGSAMSGADRTYGSTPQNSGTIVVPRSSAPAAPTTFGSGTGATMSGAARTYGTTPQNGATVIQPKARVNR